MKSKIDRIFQTNLLIYRGDRAKAKAATRATLKRHLILGSLWLTNRKRLYKKES